MSVLIEIVFIQTLLLVKDLESLYNSSNYEIDKKEILDYDRNYWSNAG